jgi:hypothetical protein
MGDSMKEYILIGDFKNVNEAAKIIYKLPNYASYQVIRFDEESNLEFERIYYIKEIDKLSNVKDKDNDYLYVDSKLLKGKNLLALNSYKVINLKKNGKVEKNKIGNRKEVKYYTKQIIAFYNGIDFVVDLAKEVGKRSKVLVVNIDFNSKYVSYKYSIDKEASLNTLITKYPDELKAHKISKNLSFINGTDSTNTLFDMDSNNLFRKIELLRSEYDFIFISLNPGFKNPHFLNHHKFIDKGVFIVDGVENAFTHRQNIDELLLNKNNIFYINIKKNFLNKESILIREIMGIKNIWSLKDNKITLKDIYNIGLNLEIPMKYSGEKIDE